MKIRKNKRSTSYDFAGPWSGGGRFCVKFNCRDTATNKLLQNYFADIIKDND